MLNSQVGEVIYREWKEFGRAYNEKELNELLDRSGADALITEHDHVTAGVIHAHPQLRFIIGQRWASRGCPACREGQAAGEHPIECRPCSL